MTRKVHADSSRKKSESACLKILKKQAIEFCLSTGLHGYKYVGQQHRSKTERVLWAVIIFISLCSAIATMMLAYNHYATRPTLMVVESTHHGIWNYPFPAVTVCNLNRVSFRLAKDFVNTLKLPPNVSAADVLEDMKLLVLLLQPSMYEEELRWNLTRLQDIFDANRLPIFAVVYAVTPDCKNLLKQCKWRNEVVPCGLIFKRDLSRDGICCTFNYITWETIRNEMRLMFANGCGYQTGLKMILDPEPDDYFAATRGSFGAKISLHQFNAYPDYNAESTLVGLNTQVFMSVSPEVTYSSPETFDLAISTRDCLSSSEGPLIDYPNVVKRKEVFVNYGYTNCMAECRVLIINEKCNCTPYYMPGDDRRTCNLRDIECLNNYKAWFDTSWPGINMSNASQRLTIDSKKRPCGCMPDCAFFRYPVESSAAVLDSSVYYDDSDGQFTRNPESSTSLRNKSIVNVFFSDLVSIQYRRDVYYNWYSLFASFGGLLGLFSGFSLMSAFELIYFFIVRVITNKCRRREN